MSTVSHRLIQHRPTARCVLVAGQCMRLVHFLACWSAYTPVASLPQHGDCQTATYACLPLESAADP